MSDKPLLPSTPITSQLDRDEWTIAINALVVLALLVAYTLHVNVTTQVAWARGG